MLRDWRGRACLLTGGLCGILAIALLGTNEHLLILEVGILALLCTIPLLWEKFRFHSMFHLTLALLFFTYVVSPAVGGWFESSPLVLEAMAYILAFVAFLVVGYHLPVGRRLGHAIPPPAATWSPTLVRQSIPLLLLAGFVGYAAYLRVFGLGILDIYARSFEIRLATFEIGGLYFARNLMIWLIWAAVYLSVIRLLQGGGNVGGTRWVSTAAVFMIAIILISPLGQRFYVFCVFLSTLILLSLNGIRFRLLPLVLMAPVVVVTSGAYTIYRGMSALGGTTIQDLWQRVAGFGVLALLEQGVRASADKFQNFLLVVLRFGSGGEGLLYGQTFVDLPWLVVPQSVFGSKPLYTDTFLRDLLVPEISYGLAFGMLSELYVNFGGLAIAIGGGVLGILLKGVDTYIEAHKKRPSVQLWLATGGLFLPFLVVGGLYGVSTTEAIFYSLLSSGMGMVLSGSAIRRRPTF